MVLARRIFATVAALAIVTPLASASAAAPRTVKMGNSTIAAPAADLTLDERSELLKAGQFVWDDASLASGPVTVVVSLPLQRMHVYQGGELVAVSTVSTGKEGKETPVGEYPILQKKVMHRSNLYESAPMPFMQRLTWDGIALHAGANPGRPASHGCVRMPKAVAEKLYNATTLGAVVYVTDMADLTIPAPGTLPYYQPETETYPSVEDSTFIETTAAR